MQKIGMEGHSFTDGYAYPYPLPSYFSSKKAFDQPKYKYLQAEETRRRIRNEDLLSKIQALKLRSSIEASRSEILRQMQMEHKILIQKYLYERKFSKPTDPHPIETYEKKTEDSHLAHASISKLYVSTGINTELTGPVRPIHPEPPFQNEKYFSPPVTTTRFHESNFNQSSLPLNFPTSTYPNPDFIPASMSNISYSLTLEPKNSALEPKSPVSILMKEEKEPRALSTRETKSKIQFLDLSTTDSENTTERRHSPNDKRRFSTSALMTPTTAALSRLLGDDTSDTTTASLPIPKITFPPRRKSLLPGMPTMLPVRNARPSPPKEDEHEAQGEDSNDALEKNGGNEESVTSTLGESLLESFHQKKESLSMTPALRDECLPSLSQAAADEEDDTQTESKSNWANEEVEGGREEDGSGDGEGRHQSHPSSSSSFDPGHEGQELEMRNKNNELLPLETESEGHGHDENETVPQSEIDDLSYSEVDSSPHNEDKIIQDKSEKKKEDERSESEDYDVKGGASEAKSDAEETVLRPQHLHLKLGYDDSESDISEKEVSKSIKKTLERKLTSEETTSKLPVTKEKEDDSLDDFFDL